MLVSPREESCSGHLATVKDSLFYGLILLGLAGAGASALS
jgi:hypothetical protein